MMMMTHDSANHTQPIRNRTPIHRTKIGLPKNDTPNNAKQICLSIIDTKMHICTTCIFRRAAISDPWPNTTHSKQQFRTHSRPNPNQPNSRVNPTCGQLFVPHSLRTTLHRNIPYLLKRAKHWVGISSYRRTGGASRLVERQARKCSNKMYCKNSPRSWYGDAWPVRRQAYSFTSLAMEHHRPYASSSKWVHSVREPSAMHFENVVDPRSG